MEVIRPLGGSLAGSIKKGLAESGEGDRRNVCKMESLESLKGEKH